MVITTWELIVCECDSAITLTTLILFSHSLTADPQVQKVVCGVASFVVCGEPLACDSPRGVGTAARGTPAGDRELAVEYTLAARRHRSFEVLLLGIDWAPELLDQRIVRHDLVHLDVDVVVKTGRPQFRRDISSWRRGSCRRR